MLHSVETQSHPTGILLTVSKDGSRTWNITGYHVAQKLLNCSENCETVISQYPSADRIRGTRGVQVLRGHSHKLIHKHLALLFSAKRLGAVQQHLEMTVSTFTAQLMQDGHGTRTVPFCTQIADPLALKAMAIALGLELSPTYLTRYSTWVSTLTEWTLSRGTDPDIKQRAEVAAEAATHEMETLIADQLQVKNSTTAQLHEFGCSVSSNWSIADTADQYRLLLLAGGEGVAQLLCTAVYKLLTHPNAATSTNESLIEESLRLYPPAALRMLRVIRALQFGDILLREGDILAFDISKINRDPGIHEDPDTFKLNRQHHAHLSFSAGPRVCIGSYLSRLLATETINQVKRVLKARRLSVEEPHPVFNGYRFSGFRPLCVRIHPEE